MKTAQQILSSHGIRPSVQRIAILQYLLDNKIHPTADEIYSALVYRMPTLSRMTVYNTIHLLVAAGVILSLDIEGHFKRFDGDNSLHFHLKCTRCGMIEDIPVAGCDGLLRTIADRDVQQVQLLLRGLCSKCAPKKV